VHAALRPGGVLLFDSLGPAFEPASRRRWSEGDGWLVCSELSGAPATGELSRRIVVFRRGADAGWRRADERHALRLHEPDEVRADLHVAGFAEVEALAAWGHLRLAPGHVAFAARRAGA
jgi:hypothetical protein